MLVLHICTANWLFLPHFPSLNKEGRKKSKTGFQPVFFFVTFTFIVIINRILILVPSLSFYSLIILDIILRFVGIDITY